MAGRGFNKYFENYNPRLVAFINLQDDLKKLYAKIDKEAKDIITKSVEAGVEIYLDQNGNVDDLYKFTSLKNKNRRKRYYQGLYNNYMKKKLVKTKP